jgi:hypothetical protein
MFERKSVMKTLVSIILVTLLSLSLVTGIALATGVNWSIAHASFDSRVCSGDWAFDTYTERYDRQAPRTYKLYFDDGHFTTVAGQSPNSPCNAPHHIHALEKGTFTGYIAFTVAGGTYAPKSCTVDTCTGDTIGQGITAFVKLNYGAGGVASVGNYCFKYVGGDADTDPGDLMQQASDGVSCTTLGTGNQGDIFA